MMAVVLQPVLELEVLLTNITSAIKEEIKVIWGVEEELEKLLGTLSSIRSVLADAEEKQETSQLVNDWLRKLRDVAYDTEDVVDDVMIEAVRVKMGKGSESSMTKQKVFAGESPDAYPNLVDIAKKIILSKASVDLVLQLKCLRVLKLEHSSLEELPDSIGDLKFLKFIHLSYAKVRMLPPSICSLYNLQRLKLKKCDHLVELPKDTKDLINLGYLDTEKCNTLKHMPPQIGKLRKLCLLSHFVSGNETGQKIAELKDLTSLRVLGIAGLENVVTADEAKEADLKNKNPLNPLHLE
ncbi:hypothetical protein H6P81_016910 [Aristolochia fimbriata]|uniref:Rx N-terminal domain-containing protein n=1 Tax=Aristolochia fimbriata TaxID=158543 RepID=A0AAV7DZM7_ARIFI|nr:hypothetical protein H6P81_016910 [Aristolochia fimbriata]